MAPGYVQENLFDCHLAGGFAWCIDFYFQVEHVGSDSSNHGGCSVCQKFVIVVYHCLVFVSSNLHGNPTWDEVNMGNFDSQFGKGLCE